ncbi:MAG: hypothetical protein U0229_12870 [Anaeromyxobacter sp.]
MKKLNAILPIAALLALLPLAGDGATTTCCVNTTSLASQLTAPVAGDEAFFKLPSGPASVMLTLDTSGSMYDFPQCGDYSWNDGSAPGTCKSPTIATPADPPTADQASPVFMNLKWTCTPSSDGTGPQLKWMENVTPKTTYADPGRTNTLLWDCPPWGDGGAGCATKCTGDACMFDPKAVYRYASWTVGNTAASFKATRFQHDDPSSDATAATLAKTCTAVDSNGNVIKDCAGNPIDLGADCQSCMSTRGFFFYRIKWLSAASCSWNAVTSKWHKSSGFSTATGTPLFKGTFLNANPPKFMSAKTVVKNLAWMDSTDTGEQLQLDQVRLGLAILDSGAGGNQRAQLIVPLGPDKNSSYPPTFEGFRQSRQYILSTLNFDQAVYKDAALNTIVDGTTITGGFFNPASGSTPLGSAVFNVGQYFTSKDLYKNKFGAAYELASFNEKAAGKVNAAWVTKPGNVQCSFCWACQNSTIIAVTDGSPNSEITFPTAVTNWDTTTYNLVTNCGRASCASCYAAADPATDTSACTTCPCAACTAAGAACSTINSCKCYSPSATTTLSPLPRIASWLHNTQLRTDFSTGTKQALTIHTIGFNTMSQLDPRAYNILHATANMGGGTFAVAGSEDELSNAVYNAVRSVIPKLNSFSVASANSLQTTQYTTSEAFVTRFKPNESFPWEGHVFEAFVFDEKLNGCREGGAAPDVTCQGHTVSSDLDGDDKCTSTFLVDKDCNRIAEDAATGDFLKAGTTTAANLPWDAGRVLSDSTKTGYRSADEAATNARSLFTWIAGSRVDLTAANAATLLPYLNMDSPWCTTLLTRLGIVSASPLLECAKEVIYFVRGWDVLDQDGDGCAGPGKTNAAGCQRGVKGEERDRAQDGRTTPLFWKLGDIAHSSPAVVAAPVHEFLCATGLEKQCKPTLFSTPLFPKMTPMPTSGTTVLDTYNVFRAAALNRNRVLYVGGNDGILHAFDAGSYVSTSSELSTDQYTPGTGEEMWGFIPIDVLPRLKNLLDGHQYLVDASVMAQDVWVDGSVQQDGTTTDLTTATDRDGVKQAHEFHTIIVFGRRTGGNQYTALDVTAPGKPQGSGSATASTKGRPTLLWNYPEGCAEDADLIGQTWADFAPKPPPIGPVRVVETSPTASDGLRGFAEKWIVAINGGYDPSLNQGRAVFFVDVWSGKSIWRFTDDDWGSTYSRPGHMYPVPAGISLLDVGDSSKRTIDNDGFFDTATWGDLGGNVWVARFWTPGTIDLTSGKVTNWFASRTFEQRRQADDAQRIAGRNEFFYMTSNVYDAKTRSLRTYLGSGNRERLMTTTANCENDDLLGCCKAGCTTESQLERSYSTGYNRTDKFTCNGGVLSYAHGGSLTATTCSAAADTYFAKETVKLNCPGIGALTDAIGTTSCSGSGLCTVTPIGERTVSSSAFTGPSHARFFGFWSYGAGPTTSTTKVFDTLAAAKTFDQQRFTDIAFGGAASCAGGPCALTDVTKAQKDGTCLGGGAPTSCRASEVGPGWFYQYGDVCPLASCTDTPPWVDEKTGSNATVVLGCTFWSSFRPVGTTTAVDPCSGTLGTPVAYAYGTDYLSGAPSDSCSGGVDAVAALSNVTAAPNASQVIVGVNTNKKTVSYSSQAINNSQANTTSAGSRKLGGSGAFWLEIPRQAHACRHDAATSASVCE